MSRAFCRRKYFSLIDFLRVFQLWLGQYTMAWRYSLSLVLKLCLNIEKVLRDCVFFRLILLLLPSGAPLSSISLIVMHSVGLPLRTSAHRWIPSTISLRKCPVIYLRSS